jgi:hypothetical protein
MSKRSSATVQCPSCGVSQNFSFYSSITATINPELRDAVLNGTFFNVSCAKCRTAITLDRPVLYSDPQKRWMVWYLPEGTDSETNDAMDQTSLMLGSLIRKRVVYTTDELIEKVYAIETGISDWALISLKRALDNERNGTWYYSGLINDGTRLRFNSPDLKVWESIEYADGVRKMSAAYESLDEGLDWVHTSPKNLYSLGDEKLRKLMEALR